LAQPNISAPFCMQGTSVRDEKGIFLSGSSLGSLRMRNSIGSIFSATASSSIAHSSASRPTASPGARIDEETGRSSVASLCSVRRFGAA
jgi:hypothetical protein